MTPDELRQSIELKVVEMIKKGLQEGTMTEERAQTISQKVLDTLKPGMSFEQLYKAIPTLDDTMPELSPITLPILREYEENVNSKALDNIRELIRQGQYDAATKMGKMAVSQDLKLVWTGAGKAKMT